MIIGIDLGTTNSAMAYYTEDEDAEVIENSDGDQTMPSVVKIEEDGSKTVGQEAVRTRILDPDRTLARTKQDMGEDVTYEVDGEEYRPEHVAANVLGRLKSDAEDALGEDVTGAVITVPYYFGASARKATEDAAKMADLNVEEIINEPTAACIAYRKDNDLDGTLLVYDLGGGTFDATLVEAGTDINVIGTDGHKSLGGENLDDALYEHVRQQLLDDGYPDPEDNRHKKASLREEVKRSKHNLSNATQTRFAYDTGEGMTEIELTREEFNDVVGDLIEETIDITADLFEDPKVDAEPADVDAVLLVGGSTRIPLVRERVEEFFGTEPRLDTNPDTIVARGAALQAAFYREDVEDVQALPPMRNVLSHSLGVETNTGAFDKIFERLDEVPDTKQKMYTNPRDDVTTLVINILEGEGEMADADTVEQIGGFELEGITQLPAGEAEVDVEFEVSPDGRLTVTAEELQSGTREQLAVDDRIGMTSEELDAGADEKVESFPDPV